MSGLSLIELVLALAIVSILAGIATAAYRGYVTEARVSTVITDLRNIAVVLDDLAMDGSLPDSLDQVQISMTDPWGNPYQYLRIAGAGRGIAGRARKDHELVPLNTDYDLYSSGPDGRSRSPLTARASRDDIVRANNGGFFGLAEDY